MNGGDIELKVLMQFTSRETELLDDALSWLEATLLTVQGFETTAGNRMRLAQIEWAKELREKIKEAQKI